MYPKQLLPIAEEHTMLQATLLRLKHAGIEVSEAIVVCHNEHRFVVADQLRQIATPAQIVLEPAARSTAPAATLAACVAQAQADSDEVPLLLVLPADHVVDDEQQFAQAIAAGIEPAQSGALVCFGVVPTFPSMDYGYIESEAQSGRAAPIRSFIEKPERDAALDMLEAGRFFWNAGIFLMRADVWLEEVQKYVPAISEAVLSSVGEGAMDLDFFRPNAELFSASPSDSIDYAVMERTDCGIVVPMDVGWSDVGSWNAVHAASEKDDAGNSIEGDVVALDCRNTLIRSKGRLVAVIDLHDLVIIDDDDALLVASRERSRDVGKIVRELDERGRTETGLHKQVFRPWGSYESLEMEDDFQVKRLIVKPGAALSLQKHAHRSEHWTVVRGRARVVRDDQVLDLAVNDSIHIPVGAIHRIENPHEEPVHIVEIQCGDYLGEDDIVRFDDDYGRKGSRN